MFSIITHFISDFKVNYTQKGLENVNLYQVMCHILGISPLPHNGTWSLIEGMLKDTNVQNEVKSAEDSHKTLILILSLGFLGLILVLITVWICIKNECKVTTKKYNVLLTPGYKDNVGDWETDDDEDYEDDIELNRILKNYDRL